MPNRKIVVAPTVRQVSVTVDRKLIVKPAGRSLVISHQGVQGLKGDPGAPGAPGAPGDQHVFVQPNEPPQVLGHVWIKNDVNPALMYVWVA